MGKKDNSPVEENKMITAYVKKGGAIINDRLVRQGESIEVTEAEAKELKKTVLAKVVVFK